MVDWNRFRQTEDGKWIDLAQPWMSPLDNAASFLTLDELGPRVDQPLPPANPRIMAILKIIALGWACAIGLLFYIVFVVGGHV